MVVQSLVPGKAVSDSHTSSPHNEETQCFWICMMFLINGLPLAGGWMEQWCDDEDLLSHKIRCIKCKYMECSLSFIYDKLRVQDMPETHGVNQLTSRNFYING
ncbi:hypothetical protein TNCT_690171 [Trichonephila clavata]|uniref:Uncharacterized protein n=1 Tax=Trichonephila clavata TaxID=2740835 RepID=A0A8X6KWH8_TRICU|nr:hypothetical protein TNCT_690171 [Trichonephila clavata]